MDLAAYGFENLKRHQALRYFTWRWSWSSVRRSEQLRFLLRHAGLRSLARAALTRPDLSGPAWDGVEWSKADRWLYTFAVRALWRYALNHGDREVIALAEPELGNPLPVRLSGRLVSQDLANTALEVGTIRQALGATKPASILEIGAGYGRSAYALLSVFPEATYTIIDIQPAIDISRWYLTALFGPERLRFLSPAEAAILSDGSVDLAISISSLQEMRPDQVDTYLRLLDRVTEGGTVYLKQWSSWRNPDDGVELDFDAYPIPPRWEAILRRRSRVQTRFKEAAWAVPPIARGIVKPAQADAHKWQTPVGL